MVLTSYGEVDACVVLWGYFILQCEIWCKISWWICCRICCKIVFSIMMMWACFILQSIFYVLCIFYRDSDSCTVMFRCFMLQSIFYMLFSCYRNADACKVRMIYTAVAGLYGFYILMWECSMTEGGTLQ